jgi:hypothetical protein
MGGRGSGLCSIGRREIRLPLCWLERQVRVMVWPLSVYFAWVQKSSVMAGTTSQGDALASVRWIALAQSATVVVGTTLEDASLLTVRFIGLG